MEFYSKSAKDTKKLASKLAREVVRRRQSGAKVVALEGDLGAGKTTFTQGFARALGVRENVLSPTFVLMKVYPLNAKRYTLRYLIHIDCYRLDSAKDLLRLGFKDLLKDKDAVVLIEWADRIKKIIPKDAVWLKFKHGKTPKLRTIKISN